MTDKFLEFSKSVGNDLSTPMPQFGFPGLKDGDCLLYTSDAADDPDDGAGGVLAGISAGQFDFLV